MGNIGLQAGFMLTLIFRMVALKRLTVEYNTIALNVGLNYSFDEQQAFVKDSLPSNETYKERIKYNIAFRTLEFQKDPFPHLGQRQFYHIGLYADKRIGRKSALQLGTDVFFSQDI